jgi:phage baseplate assembly protein W
MSFDLRLTTNCPHHIQEEMLVFSSNIVALSRMPSSSPVLKLMGEIVVPPSGLYQSSNLIASHTPNPVSDGGNLIVATMEGVYPIEFSSWEVNTKSLISKLSHIPLILVTEENGFSKITPVRSNTYIVLSGTVLSDLGFILRKASKPILVHPGYDYENGIVTLKSPLLHGQYMTADYFVDDRVCPRCFGSTIENDITLDELGEIETVKDNDLLAQIVIKAVLTEVGSNIYHPWYGSTIQSLIGKTFEDQSLQRIRQQVQDTLLRVQSQQTVQSKYQPVSLKERFGQLNYVKMTKKDYRTLSLEISHTSASGEPIVITQTFSTSGAINKLIEE